MMLESDIRIVNVVSTAELVLFNDQQNLSAAFRSAQTAELLFDGRDMTADLAHSLPLISLSLERSKPEARTAELVLHEERNMSADLAVSLPLEARIADTRSSKLTSPINLCAISDNLLKNNGIDSVKYKPDKFIAAILKQTCPIKSTCLLFGSGKFVCLGLSVSLSPFSP